MAVDTAIKRLSMLSFDNEAVLFAPTDDDADVKGERANLLALYAGITLIPRGTTPGTDPDPGLLSWGWRRARINI